MGFEEKNGQYTGFDIDLAQAVSEKLGFKGSISANRLGYEGDGTANGDH